MSSSRAVRKHSIDPGFGDLPQLPRPFELRHQVRFPHRQRIDGLPLARHELADSLDISDIGRRLWAALELVGAGLIFLGKQQRCRRRMTADAGDEMSNPVGMLPIIAGIDHGALRPHLRTCIND